MITAVKGSSSLHQSSAHEITSRENILERKNLIYSAMKAKKKKKKLGTAHERVNEAPLSLEQQDLRSEHHTKDVKIFLTSLFEAYFANLERLWVLFASKSFPSSSRMASSSSNMG